MNDWRLKRWVGLTLAILALAGGLGCPNKFNLRRRSVTRCAIDNAGPLKIRAINLQALRFQSCAQTPGRGPIDERIAMQGEHSINDINYKDGVYELSGESAVVTMTDDRPIELESYGTESVTLVNHQASLSFKSKSSIGSLKILNHAGKIESASLIEDLEISNQVGAVSLDGVIHRARVSLRGDLRASHIQDLDLDCIDGDTSITAYGRVKIQNFDYKPYRLGWYDQKKHSRADIARELASIGHKLHIFTSGFDSADLSNIFASQLDIFATSRANLLNIYVNQLDIRADDGLRLTNLYAQKTQIRLARNVHLLNISSPLQMENCSDGTVQNLEMDYTLKACSGLQISPRNDLKPRGLLQTCWNIVYWDAPAGAVTQEKCKNIIIPTPKPPAPAAKSSPPTPTPAPAPTPGAAADHPGAP